MSDQCFPIKHAQSDSCLCVIMFQLETIHAELQKDWPKHSLFYIGTSAIGVFAKKKKKEIWPNKVNASFLADYANE